jgi:hypothetical protein
MSNTMHPAAPHHLPAFITAPGETDVLLTGSVILIIILVFVIGSLYFWLHALPERIAHGTSKLQFQLVAVLALLALFTHINAFWVAALLLALVPIPDFWTPLAKMSESLASMASRRSRPASMEAYPVSAPEGVAPNSLPSADKAVRQPRPVEIVGNVPLRESSQTSPPAMGVDVGSPPVSRAQGSSPPESPSGSLHRVLSNGEREP